MKRLLEDIWAVRCIRYLIRKDYSTQEILDAMVEIGIRGAKLMEEKRKEEEGK